MNFIFLSAGRPYRVNFHVFVSGYFIICMSNLSPVQLWTMGGSYNWAATRGKRDARAVAGSCGERIARAGAGAEL